MHLVVFGDSNYKEINWDADVTDDHTSHSFVEAIRDIILNQRI